MLIDCIVVQAVSLSPSTAEVSSSHLGYSMWVSPASTFIPLFQASAVLYSMRSREYDVAGAASAFPSLNASTYSAYWTIRGELS